MSEGGGEGEPTHWAEEFPHQLTQNFYLVISSTVANTLDTSILSYTHCIPFLQCIVHVFFYIYNFLSQGGRWDTEESDSA